MKTIHPPSGITQGIPFLIAADWTPEQAMAVVELLDDLREQIWARYELQLYPLFRQQRAPRDGAGVPGMVSDDEPF